MITTITHEISYELEVIGLGRRIFDRNCANVGVIEIDTLKDLDLGSFDIDGAIIDMGQVSFLSDFVECRNFHRYVLAFGLFAFVHFFQVIEKFRLQILLEATHLVKALGDFKKQGFALKVRDGNIQALRRTGLGHFFELHRTGLYADSLPMAEFFEKQGVASVDAVIAADIDEHAIRFSIEEIFFDELVLPGLGKLGVVITRRFVDFPDTLVQPAILQIAGNGIDQGFANGK